MAARSESWFVSARDAEPGRPPRALWIGQTADLRTNARALVCAIFDPTAGAPSVVFQDVTPHTHASGSVTSTGATSSNTGNGPGGARSGTRPTHGDASGSGTHTTRGGAGDSSGSGGADDSPGSGGAGDSPGRGARTTRIGAGDSSGRGARTTRSGAGDSSGGSAARGAAGDASGSGTHTARGGGVAAVSFHGEARARGRMAEWVVDVTGSGAPLRHLRPGALYRLPLPRTKLESVVPDGIASGRVVLDGIDVDIVGWRATVAHSWGAELADRWVWLHAAGFEDEPDAWLELTLARLRIAGALTPWLAGGAVGFGGRRFHLGGLRHAAGVRVAAGPGRLDALIPGDGIAVRVAAHADVAQTIGVRRGDRDLRHAGLTQVRLGLRRPGRASAELFTIAGGAYEVGNRTSTDTTQLTDRV